MKHTWKVEVVNAAQAALASKLGAPWSAMIAMDTVVAQTTLGGQEAIELLICT